jgi:autotransporter-associated beta strand protein
MGTASTSGGLLFNRVTGTSNMSIQMNSSASITANTSGTIRFSNANFNAASSASSPTLLTLTNSTDGGTAIINGVIRDNSPGTVSVGVSGSNVWVLNGVNTYTGTTSVAAGSRLLMNGVVNASSTTTSSGYLGGTGTFGGAVSILSGTLSPGGTPSGNAIADSIGKLTVGSLSLSFPATTVMTITGSTAGSFDQIAVSGGSIDYGNSTLALTLSGSYGDLTTFGLFSGISNTNSSNLGGITLAAGGSPYADLTFTSYDNSSQVDRDLYMVAGDWITGWTTSNQRLLFSQSTGTLTVVPEPSTIVFAGIGMAMFGWSTWTRRRAKARRQAIETAIA